nr:DapH/DapD/GlmU-related protein [Ohessyouella blattaphilus]
MLKIGNNVFIGSDVTVLPGVKIGDNTIIGAGAIVSKDLPGGFLWGGVPVKRIGDFNVFVAKRKEKMQEKLNTDELWSQFDLRHNEMDLH